MSDGLNTVPVLRMHLEELERVLDFVEGLLSTRDLEAEYRKMATLHRPSKLTQAVIGQKSRIRGYLDIEDIKNVSGE